MNDEHDGTHFTPDPLSGGPYRQVLIEESTEGFEAFRRALSPTTLFKDPRDIFDRPDIRKAYYHGDNHRNMPREVVKLFEWYDTNTSEWPAEFVVIEMQDGSLEMTGYDDVTDAMTVLSATTGEHHVTFAFDDGRETVCHDSPNDDTAYTYVIAGRTVYTEFPMSGKMQQAVVVHLAERTP